MKFRELRLNNNDWPSEIPGPRMTKEEFYGVLRRIPEVYDEAMADLAATPVHGPRKKVTE